MLKIHEIKLHIGEERTQIPVKILKKLRLPRERWDVSSWQIRKESIDARDKADIRFVYSVEFSLKRLDGGAVDEGAFVKDAVSKNKGIKLEIAKEKRYEAPEYIREADTLGKATSKPPVIAGFGPCGIFAALILAEQGLSPIVVERGKRMDERIEDVEAFWADGVLNPESNVQFGEGGAGTFSDGKLTTGIKDVRMEKVLRELAGAGGGEEILYRQKPHIGTDVLRGVVSSIRERIIGLGGTILFSHRLDGIVCENGRLTAVKLNAQGEEKTIETEHLILALGHSARDTFSMLYDSKINMEQKPFSIGVRIEHPQHIIDNAQYGANFQDSYGMMPREAGLPPAEYKLSHRCTDGRGVYTFCMCPGGHVITASTEEGGVVTNGMSYHDRAGAFANSALLVDVRVSDFESDHPLAGMDFQRKYEQAAFRAGGADYRPPSESLEEFISDESILASCLPDFAVRDMREGLPVFGRKLLGFDRGGALMTGVETRSSSPVRIVRDKNCCASIFGIFPGGEGAGYAGGIMSAAVDGIRLAEAVILSINSNVK